MITIISYGGLGNILFQYAAGRHLAFINKTTLRLNLMHHMRINDFWARKIKGCLELFNLSATFYIPVFTGSCKLAGINPSYFYNNFFFHNRFFNERKWGFDPEFLMLNDQCYINGYFQSYKYFKDIRQIIQNDLKVKILKFPKEVFLYKDKIQNSNSVSIHIRRGDYLKSKVHNVCDTNYYVRAIRHMQDRLAFPHFYVFSDDIEWCRKNINIAKCNFVDIKESIDNPIIDFYLMSLCQHNIIPNSTFSWWVAWLSEYSQKIVVRPSRWYNHENKNEKALQHTIPEEWVSIDC